MVEAVFLSLLLTSLWSAVVGGTSCGRRMTRGARIVGGDLAADGEFPWAVSVLFNGFHYCGGSVVSERWILTAAHCVMNYSPGNFAVRVGFHTTSRDPVSSSVVRVNKVLLHPKFSMPYMYEHDIALVSLTSGLDFNSYVQPVCLPDCDVTHPDHLEQTNLTDVVATAVGWGYVQDSSIAQMYSAGLRKVRVPIVDFRRCQEWYSEAGKVGLELGPAQVCAGYKGGGKDACLGDSGGPLTVPDRTGKHSIVGVISAGIGCARPLLPGIYTRVSAYVEWIRQTIR